MSRKLSCSACDAAAADSQACSAMAGDPQHRLSGLLRRYDGAVLKPPEAAAAPDAAAAVLIERLQRWCLEGAGPGCSLPLRPFSPPTIEQRLRIGVLAGDAARASLVANRLSLALDGSLRLAECGSTGRVALKLQTKLHDALWWRPLGEGHAWDCGWLQGSAEALQAFRPRRPTLIVATSCTAPLLQTLRQQQAGYAHAVRLLLVGALPPPAWPADLAIGRWTA